MPWGMALWMANMVWVALIGWVSSCLTVADELASSLRTGDIGPFHVGWSFSLKKIGNSLSFPIFIALSSVYLQTFSLILFNLEIAASLLIFPNILLFLYWIQFDSLAPIIESIWCLLVLVKFYHSCLTAGIYNIKINWCFFF